MIPYNNLLMSVWAEREYQDKKWGPLEKQNRQDLARWISTLQEELNEVENAHYASRDREAILELVQVAAVALAALEQLAPNNLHDLVREHRSL